MIDRPTAADYVRSIAQGNKDRRKARLFRGEMWHVSGNLGQPVSSDRRRYSHLGGQGGGDGDAKTGRERGELATSEGGPKRWIVVGIGSRWTAAATQPPKAAYPGTLVPLGIRFAGRSGEIATFMAISHSRPQTARNSFDKLKASIDSLIPFSGKVFCGLFDATTSPGESKNKPENARENWGRCHPRERSVPSGRVFRKPAFQRTSAFSTNTLPDADSSSRARPVSAPVARRNVGNYWRGRRAGNYGCDRRTVVGHVYLGAVKRN